jgi:hypothetical protein
VEGSPNRTASSPNHILTILADWFGIEGFPTGREEGAGVAMDVKKIALLVGALLIAAVTAVMAKNMFAGASAPQAEARGADGPKVLVARKPLPVGTMVDAESFAYQPWPAELIQQAYYTEGGPDADIGQADRHRGAQSDHRRPAAHPRLAGRAAGSRLPCRGARAPACAPSPFR